MSPKSKSGRRGSDIREKLLRGALKAFAEHGIQTARIAQITEAAGVGFGSFYNHFKSREEAVDAVREAYFAGHVNQIRIMKADLADPAERMSSAIRYTVRKALQEPEWASFMKQSVLLVDVGTDPMMHDFMEDFAAGLASGRFVAVDPTIAFAAAMGIMLGMQMGISKNLLGGEHLGPRAAAIVLQALGMSPGDASEVANRPLPELPDSVASSQ